MAFPTFAPKRLRLSPSIARRVLSRWPAPLPKHCLLTAIRPADAFQTSFRADQVRVATAHAHPRDDGSGSAAAATQAWRLRPGSCHTAKEGSDDREPRLKFRSCLAGPHRRVLAKRAGSTRAGALRQTSDRRAKNFVPC